MGERLPRARTPDPACAGTVCCRRGDYRQQTSRPGRTSWTYDAGPPAEAGRRSSRHLIEKRNPREILAGHPVAVLHLASLLQIDEILHPHFDPLLPSVRQTSASEFPDQCSYLLPFHHHQILPLDLQGLHRYHTVHVFCP
jgi:hypothetical protein